MFESARRICEDLAGSFAKDFELRSRHKQYWAEILVQMAVNGVDGYSDLCKQAQQLVDEFSDEPSAAMIVLRAQLELDRGCLPPASEALRDLFCSDEFYTLIAGNSIRDFSELSLAAMNDAEGVAAPFVATVAKNFTDPPLMKAFGAYLVRAFVLDQANGYKTIEAALRCFDGARIMTISGKVSAVQNFYVGVALLSLARISGDDTPLDWPRRMGERYTSDKAMGEAKLQAAKSMVVGDFREIITEYLRSSSPFPRFLA
jgi:hypothetical protein